LFGCLPEGDPADEEKERFLRSAKVVRTGFTSREATLSDGTRTHKAIIQSFSRSGANIDTLGGTVFPTKRSWKFNVAAYRLDRLLELNLAPVAVERKHNGSAASFSWGIDGLMMTERQRQRKKLKPPDAVEWNRQIMAVRVFDNLIYNAALKAEGLLIDRRWRVWVADFDRAFRPYPFLKDRGSLAEFDGELVDKLAELNAKKVAAATGGYLTEAETEAVLARRDMILAQPAPFPPARR
jgi:hypothetical protein